jgi:hypothetical protein
MPVVPDKLSQLLLIRSEREGRRFEKESRTRPCTAAGGNGKALDGRYEVLSQEPMGLWCWLRRMDLRLSSRRRRRRRRRRRMQPSGIGTFRLTDLSGAHSK